MLGNFEEIQKNLKAKLETIEIVEESGDGLVKVSGNASKEITSIKIDPSLSGSDNAEELEDLLIVAMNRFIINADLKAAEETQNLMTGLLPPGMDLGGLMG